MREGGGRADGGVEFRLSGAPGQLDGAEWTAGVKQLAAIGFQHGVHSCRCSHSVFEFAVARSNRVARPTREVRFSSLALDAAGRRQYRRPGAVGRAGGGSRSQVCLTKRLVDARKLGRKLGIDVRSGEGYESGRRARELGSRVEGSRWAEELVLSRQMFPSPPDGRRELVWRSSCPPQWVGQRRRGTDRLKSPGSRPPDTSTAARGC